MKTQINRDWLENYKINPKRDNIIYKNYQSPGMSNSESEFNSLSPAQRERYNQFINTIPNELKGLSAVEMQKYLQDVNEKQLNLNQERSNYDNKVQQLKANANQRAQTEAQRQAQLRAQAEAQRQAQLKANQPPRMTPYGAYKQKYDRYMHLRAQPGYNADKSYELESLASFLNNTTQNPQLRNRYSPDLWATTLQNTKSQYEGREQF